MSTALSMNGVPMIKVGRVGAAWGVRGFARIQSYTSPTTNIFEHETWYLYQNGRWQPCVLEDRQAHNKGLVARFKNINDRNDVQRLTHAEIYIPRSSLPETEEQEYYWIDLEGLKVVDCQQKMIGFVDHLYETPAHDNMLVRNESKSVHIPFIQDHFVKKVDLKAQMIVVDWEESA